MSKGSSQVQETAQQRAMADFAKNQMADYKERWLPVQRQLSAQIQQAGAPGSVARDEASGRVSLDNTMQFAQAEGALEKTLANRGDNINSSRTKLAITGMGEDRAKAKGMGGMIADQQIDDAYTKGLTALTAIGRGERADVASGLSNQADQSARDAAASASASAQERAGVAGVAGQFAGAGLYGALNRPSTGTGVGINSPGFSFNNTGTSLPTAGGG